MLLNQSEIYHRLKFADDCLIVNFTLQIPSDMIKLPEMLFTRISEYLLGVRTI